MKYKKAISLFFGVSFCTKNPFKVIPFVGREIQQRLTRANLKICLQIFEPFRSFADTTYEFAVGIKRILKDPSRPFIFYKPEKNIFRHI